jgi:hypothetical protein
VEPGQSLGLQSLRLHRQHARGEFDDEVATNQPPTLPGGGSGIFDGQQILANRVPAGDGIGTTSLTTGGFHGTVTFPHSVTTLGIT